MNDKTSIARALSHINEQKLKKLAVFDSDFKAVLKLVKICKNQLVDKPNKKFRKGSWLMVMKALHAKLHSYDSYVTLDHGKRKDGTWYASLRWNDFCHPHASGYLLGCAWADGNPSHELAAKSLLKDFCKEGPGRAARAFDPTVCDRQRQANYSIAKLYEELDPKSPEDLAAKLGFQIKEKEKAR